MNAPEPRVTESVTIEKSPVRPEAEEDLDGGWFAQSTREMRREIGPLARPRPASPTGDDEVDGWLR